MPFGFFALYFEQSSKKLVRVLEGPIEPPFTTGFGSRRVFVPGLPRMEKARFKGEYPFAEVELSDSQIPLEVQLEAFNPLVPLEADDSGIPAFVLRFRVKNTGAAPARITIAGSVVNPIGYDGIGQIDGLGNDKFGQNVNEIKTTPTLRGLAISSRKVKPEEAAFGTMALVTPWPDVTYLTHWVRGDWWDDLQIFWDDFATDGKLKDLAEVSPSSDKQTDVGTLGLMATIDPGQEVVLPFILSWNFPNFVNYFDVVPEQRGRIFKNYYASQFPDAWAAAEYLQSNLVRLEKDSRAFHDAFFSTTLPPYVLDAVSSQAAILAQQRASGSKEGTTTASRGAATRAVAARSLHPCLELRPDAGFPFPLAREDDARDRFPQQRKPDGAMVFRTSLPLGSGVLWDFTPRPTARWAASSASTATGRSAGDDGPGSRALAEGQEGARYAWKPGMPTATA